MGLLIYVLGCCPLERPAQFRGQHGGQGLLDNLVMGARNRDDVQAPLDQPVPMAPVLGNYSDLIKPELTIYNLNFGRFYELLAYHPHMMDRAVQVASPKVQESMQLGKLRRDIVFLPDIALQKVPVIGHSVNDLCCGQTITEKLLLDVAMAPFPSHLIRPFTNQG